MLVSVGVTVEVAVGDQGVFVLVGVEVNQVPVGVIVGLLVVVLVGVTVGVLEMVGVLVEAPAGTAGAQGEKWLVTTVSFFSVISCVLETVTHWVPSL